MANITIEHIQNVYSFAKKVYEGKITKGEAKIEVFENSGMTIGSGVMPKSGV